MKKLILLIPALLFCMSCDSTDFDKLLKNEKLAANAGTPGVMITSPSEEEHITTLEKDTTGSIVPRSITLSGYANDGYGESIVDDNAFTWTSDINGELGKPDPEDVGRK